MDGCRLEIRVKDIEIKSFGLDEEEARLRTVFVLLKTKKTDPHGMREYVLVYQDKRAAERTCDQFNNGQSRYVFSVMETIFSGPFKV